MKQRSKNISICRAIMLLGLLFAAPSIATATEDILRPEEAYRYTVNTSDDEVIVNWTIEPEHYLYKKRMSFASLSADVELGDAELPDGIPHADEFFGEMEIYRSAAKISIPIIRRKSGAREFDLEIRSQGCADIGLCYPPQVWTAAVTFTAGQPNKLQRMIGSPTGAQADDAALPPEVAFRADVTVTDPFNIRVDWQIADGYYLYRDSLEAQITGNVAQAGMPAIPNGKPKLDEHFGQTEVFYESVSFNVPLSRATPNADVIPLTLKAQGCKEDSICYPVHTVTLDVALPAANPEDAPRDVSVIAPLVSEQDRLSQMILNGNLLVVLLTFTGLGLLLSFTPCVLPMVPILSGIIAGQGKDVTTGKAFALSLTYVLGMAVTYTLAGAAFAAMGGQIQAALQKPWIIIAVSGLFVALAMSMFGFYELQMPAFVQSRMSAVSNRQRAGSFVGTAVMGALSALVVTTCVAPPLVASMTVIAKAGDITRGALSLFAMSIGMGIPLLVIGTSAGRWLPKAGAWMNQIKGAFGFMMLGLAVWILERILPAAITMLMWAALVFVAGIFLGAFQSLATGSRPTEKLSKAFGLMAALYGAALLMGALSGATNPLQPLQFVGSGGTQTQLQFKRIKTTTDLDRELTEAAAQQRPVMLDFYADWCVSCKEMEHYTFTDKSVHRSLAEVTLLQADVTANDSEDQALLQRFGIFGPPTIVFFGADGQERQNYRVVGFMPAAKFAAHAKRGVAPFPQSASQN
jgi:thiol:disulfide interchange protein DsbD